MAEDEFETFVSENEPRLRRALIAAFGPYDGRDATASALAYAWEHWEQVSGMDNATGYLYRVGQSSRRQRQEPDLRGEALVRASLAVAVANEGPAVEPALGPALSAPSERQRVTVLLVHGFDWTHAEVADVLGVGVSTVRNHLRRGLEHLRAAVAVDVGEVPEDGAGGLEADA